MTFRITAAILALCAPWIYHLVEDRYIEGTLRNQLATRQTTIDQLQTELIKCRLEGRH